MNMIVTSSKVYTNVLCEMLVKIWNLVFWDIMPCGRGGG
jgi:hypothetical protein